MLVLCMITASSQAASRPSTVAELLEDDGQSLIKQMVSQQGGAGTIEVTDVYSGGSCVKITPMQLYQRALAGWAYKIVEKPGVGEYRFIRFAWKAPGAKGIMLQMHDEKDWNLRLTAGVDEPNWGSKFVARAPPATWTVVTRDLFADFGERTIQGIALTVFGGQPGYFDHIYFGRSIEELDAIDASVSSAAAGELKAEDLDRLWRDLADEDASKAYKAIWMLVAVPRQSVPFLRENLLWSKSPQGMEQIRKWIVELEADQFLVRERAYINLQQHLEDAVGQLKEALPQAAPESQARIEKLLKIGSERTGKSPRNEYARRVLKNIDTPQAKALLKDLAE